MCLAKQLQRNKEVLRLEYQNFSDCLWVRVGKHHSPRQHLAGMTPCYNVLGKETRMMAGKLGCGPTLLLCISIFPSCVESEIEKR
jgi:hypothetical protein